MMIDRPRIAAALPQYEIGEPLGRGAHGLVFAVRHRRLSSMRAVKAMLVVDQDVAVASQRFLTEARVMTALDHPHLVRVHEYAEAGPLLLLVMEYMAGGTLGDRMGGPVPPEKATAWTVAVADGLETAHRRGVVHRDIKPANLLFTTDGLIKVGDFGIAKLFAGSDATASGMMVGTPRYVAPEQISGQRVGPASDVYALGATLYELLAGRSVFPRELTVPGLLHHHLSVPPRPLEDVPPTLAGVVLRALAKDPAERPASAREFARELLRAADRDLGPEWMSRSGVPMRIDAGVIRSAPDDAATVPLGPTGGGTVPLGPTGGGTVPLGPTGGGAVPLASTGSRRPPGTAGSNGSAAWPGDGSAWPSAGVADAGRPGDGGPGDGGAERRDRRRGRRGAVVLAAGVAMAVLVVAGVAGAALRRGGDGPETAAVSSTASPAASPAAVSTASPAVPVTVPTRTTVVTSFESGTRSVDTLAFSADTTKLIETDQYGVTKVWTRGRTEPVRLAADRLTIRSAIFSADGTAVITGQKGALRRYDAATGRMSSTTPLRGVDDVTSLAPYSAGRDVVLGDWLGQVWDRPSDGSVTPVGTQGDGILAIAVDPRGERIASGNSDEIRLWDRRAHALIAAIPSRFAADVKFSPDGTVLASTDQSGDVSLWDAATGSQRGATIPAINGGPDGERTFFGFTAGGTALVTSNGGTLRWWSTATGEQLGDPVTLADADGAAGFSPDGTQVAVNTPGGRITIWKLS
ncbi:serine/threonine-protein kinase [Cryptosporangium japonicum]|uniref:non-specific serine/threonine protein kinase n=1 Tax=Cryptosporangium japonicum TaxID=80872 RepID=A0ABN0UDB8_9ACTN